MHNFFKTFLLYSRACQTKIIMTQEGPIKLINYMTPRVVLTILEIIRCFSVKIGKMYAILFLLKDQLAYK